MRIVSSNKEIIYLIKFIKRQCNNKFFGKTILKIFPLFLLPTYSDKNISETNMAATQISQGHQNYKLAISKK